MPESFIELCTALRALGATHVKHGAFEASFSPTAQRIEVVAKPARSKEQAAKELEALRRDELSRV